MSVMSIADRAETLRRLEESYADRAAEIRRNVEQAVSDIWRRGFCISLGALEPGSNAVGVPFLHPDGRHILAFNMTAPKSVLTRKAIESKWGPRLVNLVERLRANATHQVIAAPRQRGTTSSWV